MKRTKTKLVSSIVTLLICFAMLIGSTFAWFTDSASTGVNKIQAGNLDVELYYSTEALYDGANTVWNKVDENVKLFNPNNTALFEPGYTETVYLKVVNKGSLALDYKFSVDVINEVGSINTEGNQFKLSDYLKFGLKPCGPTAPDKYSNREAVWAAVGSTATTLGGMIDAGAGVREKLDTSKSEYFTMSVYMPTDVGNDANYDKAYNAPEINFGLTLLASQASSESDSFDNQYDADDNATNKWDDPKYINTSDVFYPVIVEDTATEEQAREGLTLASGNTVTVNDSEKPVLTMNVSAEDVNPNDVFTASAVKTDQPEGIIVASEEQAVSYEVKLTKNGGPVTTTNPVEVELFVGTKLSGVKLYHEGSQMNEDDYRYNAATGFVTFSSNSFSPFTIVYKSGAVLVKDETELRSAVAAGNDVCLANDIVLGSELYLYNVPAMTLDGNGHKITAAEGFKIEQVELSGQYMLVKIETTNEVTLKDITLEHSSLDQDTGNYHTLDIANSPEVILSNVKLIRNFTATKGGAPLVINNSNVTVKHSLNIVAGGNAWYGFNVDNGGTLTIENNAKVIIDAEKGVCGYVENGTFTDRTNTFVQTVEDLVVYPAAKIGDKKYATLDAAINAAGNGDTIKLTKAGTYNLPEMSDKEVSIIGTKDTVIDMKNKDNKAKSISFEGVTVNFGTDNYHGFKHTGNLTYKDCTITGMQFLYADEVEFNNCVFEQEGKDYYNVWTYGAKNVLFKDCTFNCAGKSVLIYNEGYNGQTVEFKNCKFNATAQVTGKAAIEIDSSYLKNNDIFTVIIDQATFDSVRGFSTGSVSNNSVWNNKLGNKATVIVAGNTVLSASSAS